MIRFVFPGFCVQESISALKGEYTQHTCPECRLTFPNTPQSFVLPWTRAPPPACLDSPRTGLEWTSPSTEVWTLCSDSDLEMTWNIKKELLTEIHVHVHWKLSVANSNNGVRNHLYPSIPVMIMNSSWKSQFCVSPMSEISNFYNTFGVIYIILHS